MYYTKPDIYFIIFGCVSLLAFLAFVFLNPKENKTNTSTEQVIDSKMLKEALDDLSQKLEKIRELMQEQEAREKESK